MHYINKTRFLIYVLMVSTILASCAGAPKVDWTLQVNGAVSQPITLTYAELTKMPQKELKDVLMKKSDSDDTVSSWSGVDFNEIIARAGAHPEFASIIVRAIDGYEMLITRQNLKDAILALKENGKWIVEKDSAHGPLRLVCPATPANKWVYAITEIQFNNK